MTLRVVVVVPMLVLAGCGGSSHHGNTTSTARARRTVGTTTSTTASAPASDGRTVCRGEPRIHFRLEGTPCKTAIAVYRGWTRRQSPPKHWVCQAAGCDNVAGTSPRHIDWVTQ